MIAAGSPPRSPTQLLRSEAMLDLLQKLAAEHDWVLIDSAPVMAVSDARVLARGVDGVAFVTRWGGTRRTTAMAALRQLADAEARIAGIALTMVDVRRNSKYEYGDSVYYSGRLRRYYSH
jgi:Mrp family chromosome partitioning ATPase